MNRVGRPRTRTAISGSMARIRSAIIIPIPPERIRSSIVTTACVARRIDELSASSGAQQRASHSVTSTPPTFELFDGALGGGDELAESH
jgi:hypothetical protein